MRGVNKAIVMGNVGRDAEMKSTTSGSQVTTFSVATTEKYTKDGNPVETTEWHNVVTWGKLAEIAGKYVKKGKPVYVEGKIVTRSWDDKDGSKKYKTEIVANNLVLLSSGGENTSQPENNSDDF